MSRAERLLEPGRLLQGPLVDTFLRDRLAVTEVEPGTRLGAWSIERELARGGMGIVYQARRADGAYEQEVAIKWLPVGASGAAVVAQFRKERRILAQLRHPHIARLLDAGSSDDGHLWFAMELVHGVPIDDYVARAGLSLQQRITLLLPIVDAVQFAHTHLLVHRDIKPGNIIVDEDGRPMLVDFGIAAVLREVDAHLAYTRSYASPEQRAGAGPDTATDIWQLGRLVQALMPTGAKTGSARARHAALAAIIERATQAEPEHRYTTAAALRDDLRAWLANRPVNAHRLGPWTRVSLAGRRHPFGTVAAMTGALVFLATVSVFMVRLAHQRDAARRAQTRAEAVNTFMVDDLLAGADPVQAGAGDVTVAEVATRALGHVEPRLGDTPKVAAQVELSLGRVLANLGHFRRGKRAYDKAIGHLEQLDDVPTKRVLAARLQREQYAIGPSALGSLESRLRALRVDVVDALGPHAQLTDAVDAQIAHAAFMQGDFATCVKRYRALLPRLRHMDPVDRAASWRNLSICETRQGHPKVALAHAHSARGWLRSDLGAHNPLTLEASMAVETALTGLGRYSESAHALHKTVDRLSSSYGAMHPLTLNAEHDLGFALTCAGRAGDGSRWLRDAARGRTRVLGRNHPWTAMTYSVLGMALRASGDRKGAGKALARARDALDAHVDTVPYARAVLLENEGDLALDRGRYGKAADKLDSAIRVAGDVFPPDHSRLAVMRLGLGLAQYAGGRKQAGRELMVPALQKLDGVADCRPGQRARARQIMASTPAE